MSFSLSHSSADLGMSGSRSLSRSLSRGVSQGSDSELSSAANQLILDYMKKVYFRLFGRKVIFKGYFFIFLMIFTVTCYWKGI